MTVQTFDIGVTTFKVTIFINKVKRVHLKHYSKMVWVRESLLPWCYRFEDLRIIHQAYTARPRKRRL